MKNKICKTCKIEKNILHFGKYHKVGKPEKKYIKHECNECRNKKRRTGRKPGTSRNCKKYYEWQYSVFKRDNFKCKNCNVKEKLIAHHIEYWKTNVTLRYDINNGMTLCRSCHMKHHKENAKKRWKKGNIPWNKGKKTGIAPWKGKKFSEEHKEKLSKAKIGKYSWNKGIKGKKSHMTGKSMPHKGKTWIIDSDTGKRKWIG